MKEELDENGYKKSKIDLDDLNNPQYQIKRQIWSERLKTIQIWNTEAQSLGGMRAAELNRASGQFSKRASAGSKARNLKKKADGYYESDTHKRVVEQNNKKLLKWQQENPDYMKMAGKRAAKAKSENDRIRREYRYTKILAILPVGWFSKPEAIKLYNESGLLKEFGTTSPLSSILKDTQYIEAHGNNAARRYKKLKQ